MFRGFKTPITRPTGLALLDKFQRDVVEAFKSFILTKFDKTNPGLVPAPTTDDHSQILYDDGWGIPDTSSIVGVTDGDKGDIVVSGTGTVWTIDSNAVTDTKLRDSAAVSVIGRSANSVGDPTDIVAAADGDVLRRASSVVGFGSIPESSVTNLVTDLGNKLNVSAVQWYMNPMRPPGCIINSAASSMTITNNIAPCWYIGRVPKAITSVTVKVNVTVVLSGTINWAELFTAKGSVLSSGNPTLTVNGITSVAGTFNSLGIKDTVITATFAAGDDMWIGFAKSATGCSFRSGGSIGDQLVSGITVDFGNKRPSTVLLNTPTVATVQANTVTTPWLAVYI